MNFAQKTHAAALVVLAVILLAGCTAAPSADANATGNGAPPSASAGQGSTPTPTVPDQRLVRTVKVIDPVTVIMTPFNKTDSLYGKDFTVHINDIVAPAKGECGYDQSLAFAKKTLPGVAWSLEYDTVTNGVYIKGGNHYGWLGATVPYGLKMIVAGMAHLTTNPKAQFFSSQAAQAKAGSVGLWGSCPGFGA